MYLMEKNGLVCALSPETIFFLFPELRCIHKKLLYWFLIYKVISLKEQDPKLFCDSKFKNKLIFQISQRCVSCINMSLIFSKGHKDLNDSNLL